MDRQSEYPFSSRSVFPKVEPLPAVHSALCPGGTCRSEWFILDELVGAGAPEDEGPSVFVVDDASELTELYAGYLAGAGYPVRTFHHRAKALAALETAERKPHLLITDYMGSSMPVEQFLHACRMVVPDLRILMASGFHPMDTRFSRVRPDRFIRKPFTAEEFLQEVRTSLF